MKRLISLLLLVTACTPTAVEESSTAAGTTPPTTTANETTTTRADGPFEYRVGMARDISTLNPWASVDRSPWSAYVLGRTTASLYRAVPDAIAVTEVLATGPASDPVEADGHWTVEVGVGGTWSDGAPVTSADLAFTFDTARRLELGGEWLEWFPPEVISIEAVADTAVISFGAEPGLAVWPFAVGLAPVLPRHHWQPLVEEIRTPEALYALAGDDAPGAGAFLVDSRVVGEEVRLLPNPSWPGWDGEPAVDALIYAVYPDIDQAIAALGTGAVDVVIDPDGVDSSAATGLDDDAISSMISQTNGFRFAAFNMRRPITGSLGFRLAVAEIVEAAKRPSGAELGGRFTVPEENLRWYRQDRAADLTSLSSDWVGAAVKVLVDSGFSWDSTPTADSPGSGFSLDGAGVPTLTMLVPAEDEIRRSFAQTLSDGLTQLGFEIETEVLPLEQVVQRVFAPVGADFPYDIYLAGWNLGRPDFPGYHNAFFGTPGPTRGLNNNTGFSSPALDALLDRYSSTRDPEEAVRILWEMERILVEQRPYVVLYSAAVVEPFRSDRVGFPFDSTLGGLQAGGGFPELVQPLE